MMLVVRTIDFDERRVIVALCKGNETVGRQYLPAFVSRCEKIGYAVDFASESDTVPAKYDVEVEATTDAFDRVTEYALIVGAAIGLPNRIIARLRLAVYELAVNTVEHAWVELPPRLRLSLSKTIDGVHVRYEDNADSFNTIAHNKPNIDDRIKNGDKRGLGLILLAEMTYDLAWERNDCWNITSFRLAADDSQAMTSTRRARMQEFKVDIRQDSSSGVAIIRPVGSVDSNTAPTLEVHIDSLIDSDQYRLVVDLSGTDFISSAGVGLFLGTVGKLRDMGGDLILMGMTPTVQDVFDLLNIKDYFLIVSSVSDLDATAKT